MTTTKFFAGSSISLRLAIGSPSTSRRSASAPSSTTPSLPGYGLRFPDSASSSAFVDVAMINASAGVYQRVSEARIAPCCCASAGEQDIGAPCGLELVLLRQLVGRAYAGPDLFRLRSLDRTDRKAQYQSFGDGLHPQPNPLL